MVMATIAGGGLAIALVGLFLNIATGQGVYEISKLQHEQKNLAQSTAILGSQVDSLSSPQNLSNAAQALGMIANANPVFLDVENQKVSGKPKAALAGSKLRISKNLVPNSQLIVETKKSDLKQAIADAKTASKVTSTASSVAGKVDVATQNSTKTEVVSSSGGIPASPTH
jgi:cell division protein FtsL